MRSTHFYLIDCPGGKLMFDAGLPPPDRADPLDPTAVRQSWQALIDLGARTFFPAHGEPFARPD